MDSEDPSPSNLPLSLGVCLDSSLELVDLEALIREPAIPSGFTTKVSSLEVSGGNRGPGLKALGLFLLLSSVVRRSEPGLISTNEPLLEGFTKSPAQSFTFAMRLKNGSLRKWQTSLFRRKDVFESVTAFWFKSEHKTASTPYRVLFGSQMPPVEIYLESARTADDQNPSRLSLAPLPFKDLSTAAQNLVEHSRESWPDYKLPGWLSAAAENKEKPHYGPESDLLKPWLQTLRTDQRWNSLFIPPSTWLPLNEVYTDLYLVKSSEFEPPYSQSVTRPNNQSSLQWRTSIESFLLGMQSHGIIIGGPGAGKSTLVRRIASQLDKNRTVPLVVLLREFAVVCQSRPDLGILEYFFERECKHTPKEASEARNSLQLFRAQHGSPQILLILDGWDEIPADLRPILLPKIDRERADFKTLITTRPSGIPATIAHNCDRVAQIASLSPRSARTLIVNVSHSLGREGIAHRIFHDLDHNPTLNELASNPFTLTLVTQITCQRVQKLGQRERLTEVITQAVDLVRLYQETVPGIPKIRPQEMAQLETIARKMSFEGPQKRLQFSATSQKPPFEETGIAKSRLLDRLHLVSDTYGFVHLRYQEYFAGRGIINRSKQDLQSALQKFGLSWDWLEEWRFAAGTLQASSKNFHVFWDHWKGLLEAPDLFGGIHCYVAWLVIESGANDGGKALVGIDLRNFLLSNIFRAQWLEESTRALISLDMGSLVLGVTSAIQNKTLPHEHLRSVIELISPVIRETTGLNEVLISREDFAEYAFLGRNRISPPTGLAQHREILRDQGINPDRRREAFKSISAFEDHESIEDAASVVDSGDWDLFILATRKLHEIGSREAAVILTRKLIDLVGARQKEAVDLIVSKLQLRRNGILEPGSRDLLLTAIKERNHNDPTLVPLLEALAGLPLMEEAEILVDLLEGTERDRIRFATATALGCCSDPGLVGRILDFMRSHNEERLSDRILSSLAQGRHDLAAHFEWLWHLFLQPGQKSTIKNSLINLFQKGSLSEIQQAQLEAFIIQNIKALSEGGDTDTEILTQKYLRKMGPFNREKAAQLLGDSVLSENLAIETRQLACSLLEACGVPAHVPALIKILSQHWQQNPDSDLTDRFEKSLVRTILALDPEALIAALRNDDWKCLPRIQGQLQLWSDRHKRLIFREASHP